MEINQAFFDKVVDRTKNGSSKWTKYDSSILPLWIADMDFNVSPIILESLKEDIEHGVFGYQKETDELNELVCSYLKDSYDWDVMPVELVWLPSARSAMYIACKEAIQKKVIASSPIYPPFLLIPPKTGKELVDIPLKESEGSWQLDFPALANNISSGDLYMLSNPHNPVGRVYKKEELEQLASMIIENDAILFSDEVHSSLILDESLKHIPIATLSQEIAKRTVTVMGVGKSYNVSGLAACFAVIQNPKIRAKFLQSKLWLSDVPISGYSASRAVYKSHGLDPWKIELIKYLKSNYEYLKAEVDQIDGMSITPLEATYLAWIDCRELVNKKSDEIGSVAHLGRFFEKKGLGLGDGTVFGKPGYMRLNFATSRANLEEAVKRLTLACK